MGACAPPENAALIEDGEGMRHQVVHFEIRRSLEELVEEIASDAARTRLTVAETAQLLPSVTAIPFSQLVTFRAIMNSRVRSVLVRILRKVSPIARRQVARGGVTAIVIRWAAVQTAPLRYRVFR